MSENEQAAESTQPSPQTGHISNIGMLDLRFAKTPEDLSKILSISDVGAILIPEHLAGVLAGIPTKDVGGVIPIPQDVKVNCVTGQIWLSGEALALGDPETILIIAGQAFISGEVKSVGYKEIRVFGQMFAPRNGQAVLSTKLAQLNGQNLYLPADPRMIMGEDTIGREFLELLPEPAAFVVMGKLTFEQDVTRELLKAKVPEIVLMGEINAPRALVPLLNVITKEKMGVIVAVD